MTLIKDILSHTAHRPYKLPLGKWKYYQEWKKVLFLHWKIPFDILRSCVPQELNLDTFDGDAYVSLVAFKMEKIRHYNLPAFRYLSNFEEINLRTYINNNGRRGVYFLSIEAGNKLSTFIAKTLSRLPYEKASITRSEARCTSWNNTSGNYLEVDYDVGQEHKNKSELDKWLTERYCLYFDQEKEMFRYDIHHTEWPIKTVEITRLKLGYKIGKLDLSDRTPDLTHYSEGVNVIAWAQEQTESNTASNKM